MKVTDVGNQMRNAPEWSGWRQTATGRWLPDEMLPTHKGKLDKRWLKGSSDKDMASGCMSHGGVVGAAAPPWAG